MAEAERSAYGSVARIDPDLGRVVWTHWCMDSFVEATLPNTGWTIVGVDPLTVTPSVACDRCGWHGTITNGRPWPVHAPPSKEDTGG